MSVEISSIVAQFGAYYKPDGSEARNLRNMLYAKQQTAAYFRTIPTSDTRYKGSLASLDSIIQAFQEKFTPKGTTTFKPNQFDLFNLKIDLKENPDKLVKTYLGFLADDKDPDRANWLFPKWLVEQHIMPKKDSDLELHEYGTGVFEEPTDGVPSVTGKSMDGILKVLYDYSQGGRLNLGNGPISMGEIPTANKDTTKYIEEFCDNLPEEVVDQLDYIFVSPQVARRYRRGKKELYNANYSQVSDLSVVEDYENIKIVGLKSHRNCNTIWTSTAQNRIAPTKKQGMDKMIKVQQFEPRVVSIYADWWMSLNFEVPEFVFTNDQFPDIVKG